MGIGAEFSEHFMGLELPRPSVAIYCVAPVSTGEQAGCFTSYN